jgi:hypothetical protein
LIRETPPPESEPIDPCLLDPGHVSCPVPIDGKCPEGYGMNEDGQCFPQHERCPDGYHSHEDDESGKCIPDSTPCDDGYIMNPEFPSCDRKEIVCAEHPDAEGCATMPPLPPCYPAEPVTTSTAPAYEPICQAPVDRPGENYQPKLPNVDDLDCKDVTGTVRVIGEDIYLLDRDKDGIGCEANERGPDDDDDDKKVIVKKIDIHKTIDNTADFPEVDVIGLSIKDTGEAMVCIMNIDNSWVQCQEFGVPNDRINKNIWRIVETDQDKDYDNGNSGSNHIDLTIGDIREYDFEELDDDRTNHDFNIDMAAVGINPVGDGLVCLIKDRTNEGTALCEPFKVSNQAVSGQITEITEV